MAKKTAVEPRRDRRHARHEATKREILDAAWQMVRADGVNALSLRALAHAVDMEPQSLYTYFASKHAVYDHLFADGNRDLLTRFERLEIGNDPAAHSWPLPSSSSGSRRKIQARYEFLFLRTIPDFEPSPMSYAIAVEVFSKGRTILAGVGLAETPT